MQVEKLKTIDADTLLSTPIRKTLFVVDGLIPQGLSVLSGYRKQSLSLSSPVKRCEIQYAPGETAECMQATTTM